MGLTSANNTPSKQMDITPSKNSTPNTPSHLLDTFRKPTTGSTPGLKEHERIMDDLKKENFDLKLKCYHIEDQLRKQAPANVEAIFSLNEELVATNEALSLEVKSLKEILNDSSRNNGMDANDQDYYAEKDAEIERLKDELNSANSQLSRSIHQLKNYETQLELFDKESREMSRNSKQMELELSHAQKRTNDLQKQAELQNEELQEMREELERKDNFIMQLKREGSETFQELDRMMSKTQELENRIRMAENERDQLRMEGSSGNDAMKRRLADVVRMSVGHSPGSPGTPGTPGGSPRSSFDLLESKLLKQIGATSRQLETLSKSNTLSQSEKEQLTQQSSQLLSEVNSSLHVILIICNRIAEATGLQLNANIADKSLSEAIAELGKLVEAVVIEYEETVEGKDKVEAQLRETQERLGASEGNLHKASIEGQHLREECQESRHKLEQAQGKLGTLQTDLFKLEQQLRALHEHELPKYKEQIRTQDHAIQTLETELGVRQERTSRLQSELDASRNKCKELEISISKSSIDHDQHRQELAQHRQNQADLLKKLGHQEEEAANLRAKLDDAQEQFSQMERIKGAIEDNFNRELKSLHASNSSLKNQLAALSTGRENNDQRVERLQSSLRYVEGTNEDLQGKLKSKESAYNHLLREHEMVVLEKESNEKELRDLQQALQQTKDELQRIKRADQSSRRGTDGLEHLQGKVDNLSKLNARLRDQVQCKEEDLQSAHDKLRAQEDSIKKAYQDCEYQHQKIKKRELIINRVLKRLENINAISGLSGMMDETNIGGDGEVARGSSRSTSTHKQN